ncbi:MAG: hypothetical protein GEU83_14160 [Pseudonocardiaceae bacterium]|nr:hypothetical protein [Pseudonocardiaceae bacterium]
MSEPLLPRYGIRSLAEVVPSLLAALAGEGNPLDVAPARAACLLVIDGLDGRVLAVIADHGMVEVTDPVDADAEPALRDGVRALAGDGGPPRLADPGRAARAVPAGPRRGAGVT